MEVMNLCNGILSPNKLHLINYLHNLPKAFMFYLGFFGLENFQVLQFSNPSNDTSYARHWRNYVVYEPANQIWQCFSTETVYGVYSALDRKNQ